MNPTESEAMKWRTIAWRLACALISGVFLGAAAIGAYFLSQNI